MVCSCREYSSDALVEVIMRFIDYDVGNIGDIHALQSVYWVLWMERSLAGESWVSMMCISQPLAP